MKPKVRTVYRIDRAGSMSRLKKRQEPLPAPAANEVQLRLEAIGLNFADIFAIWGLYSATPQGSFIPGLEYAGIVEATGNEVTAYQPGDAVMGVTKFGAYASHLNIDQRYVLPLPQGWDLATGAAYPVQTLTAYYALLPLGDLQHGQTVLIHSAAGGVGLMANRIAKKFDAYTIGSIGSPHKTSVLQQEGYDQVLLRDKHFAQKLKACLQGRELKLVLECIGGKILRQSFEQLAPMGRLVSYGSAQYASRGKRPNYLKLLYHYLRRPKLDAQNLINQNKSFMAFNLIHLYDRVELMHRYLEEIARLELRPPRVGHRFDFDELPQALAFFQTGQSTGKVVVEAVGSN